jgi:hypothetical protein
MERAKVHWLNDPCSGRLLSGPLVTVIVGADKDQREWTIHRSLLAYQSPYFAQRFGDTVRNAEKENASSRVELLEDSPTAFELFVKWLYQGGIDDVSAIEFDKKWDYAFACQQLYVLCERLRIPQLKNIAIDQFRRGCYEAGLVPGPEEMIPIYESTPKGSPFRKLISRIAARQIMDPEDNRDASTYEKCFEHSPDFAIDLVNAIRAGMGGKLLKDPTELVGCEYHDHSEDPVCALNNKQASSGSSILK